MEAYFDNSATTKPYKEVVQAVSSTMEYTYANPSSIYSIGEEAKELLQQCRRSIAKTINADEEEFIFTSGGSESNNLLIKGTIGFGKHIITTNIEHSSILNCCEDLKNRGVEVTYLTVDKYGRINLKELLGNIKENTEIISIMHVNNETGVVQDIETIGRLIKNKNKNIKFHVDAVQSYGKLELDVKRCNIDLMAISAHKIHGPRGVGGAFLKKGLILNSFIEGGGQEKGVRSGTENLPGIVGFKVAAEMMSNNLQTNYEKVLMLRNYLLDGLFQIPRVKVNSNTYENHLPHIVNISIPAVRSGKILFYLDKKCIYVSKGSACSARNLKDSHVLKAMGLSSDEIMGSLRISFSELNSIDEIKFFLENIKQCIDELSME